MRLGEILINSEMATAAQLASGLDYANAKSLPLGRVLKLLKIIEEHELRLALDAQYLIRTGASADEVLPAVKKGRQLGISLKQALAGDSQASQHQGRVTAEASKPGTAEFLAPLLSPGGPREKGTTEEIEQLLKEAEKLLIEDKLSRAEPIYKEAKELAERSFGPSDKACIRPLHRLANFYLLAEQFQDAEPLYFRILELKQKEYGDKHFEVSLAIEDLADLYSARGEWERSLQFYEKALAISEEYMSERPDRYSLVLKKLNPIALQMEENHGKLRLGDILVAAKLVKPTDLERGLEAAKLEQKPLGKALQDLGFLNEVDTQATLTLQQMLRQGRLAGLTAARALRVCKLVNMDLKKFLEATGIAGDINDFDEAFSSIVLLQEKLIAAEMESGPKSYTVGKLSEELAGKHERQGNMLEAARFWKKARTCLKGSPEREDKERLIVINKKLSRDSLVGISSSESEALLLETLELLATINKSSSVESFSCLIDLARLHAKQGQAPISASFLRSAVSVAPAITRPQEMEDEDLVWIGNTLADFSMLEMSTYFFKQQRTLKREAKKELPAQVATMLGSLLD